MNNQYVPEGLIALIDINADIRETPWWHIKKQLLLRNKRTRLRSEYLKSYRKNK